jgi:hypothetical protein
MLAGLFIAAAAAAAIAHHGTSQYDMSKEVALSGTVKEWRFSSPHTWLWLNVTAANGLVEEWSIESAPPNYMARQGWSDSMLKKGEEVKITISPRRGEAKSGILLEVAKRDGAVMVIRPRGSFGRPAKLFHPSPNSFNQP